jgi:hypothetical protein
VTRRARRVVVPGQPALVEQPVVVGSPLGPCADCGGQFVRYGVFAVASVCEKCQP